MTDFESMLQQDAQNVFAGSGDFGEEITVWPDGTLATAATFFAQVFRQVPEDVRLAARGGSAPKPAPTIEIFIPNDPTGVHGLAASPNRRLTVVFVSEKMGDPAIQRTVTEIKSQDIGGWLVVVH
jgi:hypothetical protein